MDKNLVLAVTLSILVYVGWFSFIDKRYGGPGAAVPAGASRSPLAEGGGRQELKPKDPQSQPPQTAAPEAAAGRDALEGSIPVEAGRLALRIQPLGASIVSLRYPGPLGAVELVPIGNPGFLSTWPGLRFERKGGPESLAFEAQHPSGVRIRKEYTFKAYDQIHSLRVTLANPKGPDAALGDWSLWLGPGLGTVASEQKENPSLWQAVALLPPPQGRTKPQLVRVDLEKDPFRHEGALRWAGLQNRYFLAAVFPPEDVFTGFEAGTVESGPKTLAPWVKVQPKPLVVPSGGSVSFEIPFYVGPKGYTRLKEFGLGLERSVDFGWFDRLGRVTLRVLNFFHDATGNWGWAIILLTLSLSVLLFPLTYKSMRSMAAMKRVQPEMARLQQKFGKDPARLNQEMLALYRKHGANPLGGCLPMLAQMPVFVALFNTLRNAWELHGAPWVLWVDDLSAADPYYILPIVMGAVMFFQNKLNPPQTADPAQAKVMTYMPVIFTFMFLNFPAGLVLYWLTNSLLSFGQQMALKDRLS